MVLLLMTMLAPPLTAQTVERTQKMTRTFQLDLASSEVKVINKYGNIMVIPWEKDSVRFEIDVTVKASDKSKLEKAFDYIDIDFSATPYYIIAQSNLTRENGFWADVVDIAQTIFDSKINTSVDYKIYMPAESPIIVENKFGDVYFSDHKGKVNVKLSNGAFKAHTFTGYTTLDIHFAKVNIHSIDEGHLTFGYSSLKLDRGNNIRLYSRSTEYRFDYIQKLKIQSKRDNFFIREIGDISGESYFTDYEILALNKSLDLVTNYGECDLTLSRSSTERLRMNSSYSDYTFKMDQSLGFEVELIFDSSTELFLPEPVRNSERKLLNEDEELYRTSFKVGRAPKTIPVRFKGKGGNIRIDMK